MINRLGMICSGAFVAIPALTVIAVSIAACSVFQPTPATPAQALYEAKGDYLAALTVADAYAALPLCQSGGPVLCKTKPVLDQIRQAADKANTLLAVATADLTAYQAGSKGLTVEIVMADIAAFQTTAAALQALTDAVKVQ
jgi:hypothetical protein